MIFCCLAWKCTIPRPKGRGNLFLCCSYNNDVVTRVPTRLSGYCDHLGNLLYFSSKGKLHRNDSMSFWGKFWDRIDGGLERFLEFQIQLKQYNMTI